MKWDPNKKYFFRDGSLLVHGEIRKWIFHEDGSQTIMGWNPDRQLLVQLAPHQIFETEEEAMDWVNLQIRYYEVLQDQISDVIFDRDQAEEQREQEHVKECHHDTIPLPLRG